MTAVTGGAGFIGSHLVAALRARGEVVRVIERPGADTLHLSGVEVIHADIRDRAALTAALKGCRRVYHLAADPNLWEPRRGHFHQVNYLGTVNVLDAARDAERILHCSTESILTRARQSGPIRENQQAPLAEVIGPYCRSKWRAENAAWVRVRAKAPIVIVNPTLPVGPGDRGLSPPSRMMLDFCRQGRSAYLDATLNLIDVRDVAEGMIRAMDRGTTGQRYLLGAENWSVKEIFDLLAEMTGHARPRRRVPYALALAAAYVSEFVADVVTGRSPAATITGVRLAGRSMVFDPSATLSALDLKPRPVAAAIRDAVAWFRQSGRM